MIPGDPIAATLEAMGAHHYSEEMYAQMAFVLGFEYNSILDDYILRFPIFLGDFLTGAWGNSVSLIRGASVIEVVFVNDTILHVILISAILLIIGTIFMINKSRKKSIFFHTLVFEAIFVSAFVLYLLFSDLFNIRGFGKLLVDAIELNDYYVITGCLFLTLIIIVLIPLASNVIFSIYKLRISKPFKPELE